MIWATMASVVTLRSNHEALELLVALRSPLRTALDIPREVHQCNVGPRGRVQASVSGVSISLLHVALVEDRHDPAVPRRAHGCARPCGFGLLGAQLVLVDVTDARRELPDQLLAEGGLASAIWPNKRDSRVQVYTELQLFVQVILWLPRI